MTCNGNSTEFCGGANRADLYGTSGPAPVGWTNLGCYTDNTGARTLATPVFPGVSTMSVENCTAACSAAGFTLAGVEVSYACAVC
jgi:hypothetical protein